MSKNDRIEKLETALDNMILWIETLSDNGAISEKQFKYIQPELEAAKAVLEGKPR